MSAGIKANNDGSGAIQVGGSDYITISAAGAVAIPQTLALPTIKSNAVATPPTIQDSAGTEIGTFCRAWVNFDGAGVVTVRASFNVTSITDLGVGDYRVNFTNALPDIDYAAVVTCGTGTNITYSSATASYATGPQATPTTLTYRYGTGQGTVGGSVGSRVDNSYNSVAIFR